MKKLNTMLFGRLLILATAILLAAFTAKADDVNMYWLSFESADDGSSYSVAARYDSRGKLSGKLIIPAEYNNLPVKYIKESGFQDCYNITSLEIPESVIFIGSWAFSSCRRLTSITIPESVTSIGEGAFCYCSDLTNVIIPESVTSIGSSAFSNCSALTDVIIGESVTTIGSGAFKNCRNLTNITIPKSVVSIGFGAFHGCSGLTDVTIGESVTTIDSGAFGDCPNLSYIHLPKSVKVINWRAFSNSGLKILDFEDFPSRLSVNLPLLGNELQFGITDLKITLNGKKLSISTTDVLHIPEGTTSLGGFNLPSYPERADGVFYGYDGLIDGNLPESLNSIGNGAFYQCSGLTNVVIPNSVESIGYEAFSGSSISSVKFPENDSFTHIPSRAFSGCYKLSRVEIPDNVEKIDWYAFANTPLSFAKLGSGVVYIGENAFPQSLKLMVINATTPPTLDSVNMGYSDEWAYGVKILVPKGSAEAYRNEEGWKNFDIIENESTMAIVHLDGSSPLAKEIKAQTGIMPGTVTELTVTGPLSNDDFRVIKNNLVCCYKLDMTEVTNATIPASLFYNNGILNEICLPNSLTEIPENAFRKCNSLTHVNIPSGLKKIGPFAFYDCRSLDIDRLPDGITEIGDAAFNSCTNLMLSELPQSLATIGEYAFWECRNLRLQSLPDNLTTIGNWAFADCSFLSLTALPSSLTEIGTTPFSGCNRIRNIDMSEMELTEIPDEMFAGCSYLRSVSLPESIETIGMNAFSNTKLNFIDFPASTRAIGGGAFSGTRIIAVTLPEKVTTVASYAFGGCKQLASINFPATMETIEDAAFYGCTQVKSISCPNPVPPTVAANGFDGIRTRFCAISIPRHSFHEYLNATIWGSFTQLDNNIKIEVEADNGVDVSAIESTEYDNVVETITEEDTAAAEEASSDDPGTIKEGKFVRHAARAKAAAAAPEKALNAFTRLYDNSALTVADNNTGYIFRIGLKEGYTLDKVEYDGQDMTSQVENGILKVGAVTKGTALKVTTSERLSDIDNVVTDNQNMPAEYFNLQGLKAGDNIGNLAPGIYIKRQGSKAEKIIVR